MSFRLTLKNGLLLAALGVTIAAPVASWAAPFKFGVLADTQWKTTDATNNPSTVALGIINQIMPQFVNAGVKFVVQVGDMTDNGSNAGLDVWLGPQTYLNNNNIALFPVRGNHEASQAAAVRFQGNFPQTRGLSNTFGATGFSSPSTALNGLTYTFNYDNVNVVMLDQFTRIDGSGSSANSAVIDQVNWVVSTMAAKPADHHGFFFAHKNLIGQNHTDVLFGANPSSNPTAQNTFMSGLQAAGVRYVVGGHDHMHHRSIVTAPDGLSKLQNIISSSDSYKFYTPANPSNDVKYNTAANGIAIGPREKPVAQELNTVGYYIFNVDGPRLTVKHYASANGCGGTVNAGVDCDLSNTPTLNFVWRETYGYSLNGKEFIIPAQGSFTSVADSSPTGSGWKGTTMAIVDGINTVSSTVYDGRLAVQDINTGWTEYASAGDNLKSDALTLWGMKNTMGSDQADQFTLTLSYDGSARGSYALVSRDETGEGSFVNTADRNFGGSKKFIVGPWKSTYGVGTYGIDPATSKAWAVLNRGGQFAVVPSLDGDLNNDGVIDNKDVALIGTLLNQPASALPGADLDNDGKITGADARKLVLICTNLNCK